MKIFYIFFLINIDLLLSPISQAQLKYVGKNAGATAVTVSYSKLEITQIISGQINFTKDGNIGVGMLYQHSFQPVINGIGIECEYSLYRPVDKIAVGINLLGALALTWTSVSNNFEKSLRGQSAVLGIESYLHCAVDKFKLEPFIQLSRTFSKIFASELSKSSAINSIVLGIDFITGKTNDNFFVFTPGLLIQEHSKNAVALSLSFIHSVK